MENLYFKSKEEIHEYISKHFVKGLGVGCAGSCYLLDNGMVIKELDGDYYPEFVLQFKDFDVSSFVFAKSGAFVEKFVNAVFMDYAPGKTLYDSKPVHQDIITLGKHLEQVSKDIIDISKYGVIIKDFHCGNIMYDNQQMRIIDTVPYLYLKKGDFRRENILEVMTRIYGFLLEDIITYRSLGETRFFRGKQNLLENPEEYFTLLKDLIEKDTDSSVNTLKDASLVLRKKYRR